MKTKSKASPPATRALSDDEIRDYAFHLYQQSGCLPDRDLENWLEARACLEANIPREHSHTRLHRHRNPSASAPLDVVAVGTRTIETDDLESGETVIVEEILLAQPTRRPNR